MILETYFMGRSNTGNYDICELAVTEFGVLPACVDSVGRHLVLKSDEDSPKLFAVSDDPAYYIDELGFSLTPLGSAEVGETLTEPAIYERRHRGILIVRNVALRAIDQTMGAYSQLINKKGPVKSIGKVLFSIN